MDPVEPWIDGNAVRRLAAQLLSSPGGSEITDSPDAGFGPGFEGFTAGQLSPEIERVLDKVGPAIAAAPHETVAPADVPVAKEETHSEEKAHVAVVEVPVPTSEHVDEAVAAEPEAKPFLAVAPEETVEPDDSSEQPFKTVVRPEPRNDGGVGRGPLMERMLRFREWLTRHAEARSVFVLDRDGQPVLDDPAFAKLHFLARSLAQAYKPAAGQAGNVHVKVGADAYLVVIPVETDFGRLVLGTVLPKPLDAPSVETVAGALVEAARPQR